jgi:hypothetical protein
MFTGHCDHVPDASASALVQLHSLALTVHEPTGFPPTSSFPPHASVATRTNDIQVRMRHA